MYLSIYLCVLRFFHSITFCLKYCTCHEVMRSAAPFTQNHLNCQTWRSDAPKCNPSQEICSRTVDHVWRIRSPREMHLCRPSSNVPRLPFFFSPLHKTQTFGSLLTRCRIHSACHPKPHPDRKKWSETVSFSTFDAQRCFTCTFSTPQLAKVVWHWCAFGILTPKYASHHNGVPFFEQLSYQKRSEPEVF